MSITDQKARAQESAELWRALMPGFDVPGEDQFLLWAGYHSPEVINLGINRAAAKRLSLRDSRAMTLNEVVRYASGTMRNARADFIAQAKLPQAGTRN